MTADEPQQVDELFATTPRNKPQRTYSHKGKSGRAVLLPALKPTVDTPTPANTGVRLRRFRIDKAESWGPKPVAPVVTEELPVVRTDGDGEEEYVGSGGVAEAVSPVRRETREANGIAGGSHDDQITSPLPPLDSPQSISDAEEPEVHAAGQEEEGEEDNDEDGLIILSQRPPGSHRKHDRRTGNGMRSLRRRPFLIFDKTEAKGYKQLKTDHPVTKTPPALRHRPGDGFSGREAKPNGSNLLTRSGKQAITNPHVGMLDLTQTAPAPAKHKRSIRRANLDDNSFASAPKKKVRRPLAPKDTNQQLKPAPTTKTSIQVRESSLALGVADKLVTAPAPEEPEIEAISVNQPPDPVTENAQQRPVTACNNDDADQDDEVDIIIPKSDDLQDDATTDTGPRGALGETQDSSGTRVSVSPPRKIVFRARSASPKIPSRLDAGEGGTQLPKRVLRRVETR